MKQKPRFNIGDTAWKAWAGAKENWVQCPHCFGKKFLTAILGDDSQVTIDCAGCQSGYKPPLGVIRTYEFQAEVAKFIVSNIESNGDSFRFNYNDDCDVFATESEALARAAELVVKHEADELANLTRRKSSQNHTWAWNATYHRRELKRAKHDVEYHSQKLSVAASHAKEEKKP